MLLFAPRKKSSIDQLTKVYLNIGSNKNNSIYQHQDIENSPQQKKKNFVVEGFRYLDVGKLKNKPHIKHFDSIKL